MHDPTDAALQLASKLAERTRHVCLLTGAGTGQAAGRPGVAALSEYVLAKAVEEDASRIQDLLDGRNIEGALSRVRRIGALLQDGGTFQDFDYASAVRVDKMMSRSIINAISEADANVESFEELASWLAGEYYTRPIEVCTVNYDTLIEESLESRSALYFDGFVGSIRGRFQSDLVDADSSTESRMMSSSFVRVWKLHGSINWEIDESAVASEVVRRGVPVEAGGIAAIHPSDEKYDASRRVPFVVLMDRFRKALREPETLTVISGYSFGDAHLNEIIFQAAQDRPRSDTTVLCYGDIPAELEEVSVRSRNVTVLAPSEAIIGGQRASWSSAASAISGIWNDGRFLLGDFKHFATFLSGTRGERGAEE